VIECVIADGMTCPDHFSKLFRVFPNIIANEKEGSDGIE
jgi:hypothetical protein